MTSHDGDVPPTDASFKELRALKDAWLEAPPVPDLKEFLTEDILSDPVSLHSLIQFDVEERLRVAALPAFTDQDTTISIEHYQQFVGTIEPGSDLARLVIHFELRHAGTVGPERLEEVIAQRSVRFADDVKYVLDHLKHDAPTSDEPPTKLHSQRSEKNEDTEESYYRYAYTKGQMIGPYKLRSALGHGGFGEVWVAERSKPTMNVALKLIRADKVDKKSLARFEVERQALALLSHENIARIHDAGYTDDGLPYFAMEYVQGEKLTSYCDRHCLTIEKRLELFACICDAVHYAHMQGLIHRDLSPDNILVSIDQKKQPIPKIIDFGIAKAVNPNLLLTDRTLSLEFNVMIGKLEYMSPEQAEGGKIGIDTRSDIFSLGVILYELLAGVLPLSREDLKQKAIDELLSVIRFGVRPDPSTGFGKLDDESKSATAFARGKKDISEIAKVLASRLKHLPMKAMRHDRAKRFTSASAMALDIRNYLEDKPYIEAAAESKWDKFKMTVRRNPAPYITAALVFITLVAGVSATTWQWQEALDAKAEEQQRADELQLVIKFQESQWLDIHAAIMGSGLREDIIERYSSALTARRMDEKAFQAELQPIVEALARINFTDVGLNMLYEHVFAPALRAVETDFKDEPLLKARLLQSIADTLKILGLFEQATDPQAEALKIRQARLDDDHPDVLSSVAETGRLLAAKGLFAQAEEYYRRAMVGRREILGNDDPETIKAIGNMAFILGEQSKWEEAEPLYREAVELSDRFRGPSHRGTFTAYNNLAYLFQMTERYDEALDWYKRTLAGREKAFGPDDLDTLNSVHQMGFYFGEIGQYEEALKWTRRALAGRSRVLGTHHRDTINTKLNVANQIGGQRRTLSESERRTKDIEAEELLREAYAEAVEGLGPTHRLTHKILDTLCGCLAAQDKDEDASGFYKLSYEVCEARFGPVDERTITALSDLGAILWRCGQLEEAEEYLRDAVERSSKSLVVSPEEARYALSTRSVVLRDLQRFQEAESMALQAKEVAVRLYGGTHETSQLCYERLADLYTAWDEAEPDKGYDAKAAEWRALPLETKRQKAERSDATANDKNEYAWSLLTFEPADLRDPETALRLAREVCDMTNNSNPAYLDTLALAQFMTGDIDAAIETEKKALSLLPADTPGRGEYEAALAKYEAALEDKSK